MVAHRQLVGDLGADGKGPRTRLPYTEMAIRRALEANPKNSDCLFKLGHLLVIQEDKAEEAKKVLERGMDLIRTAAEWGMMASERALYRGLCATKFQSKTAEEGGCRRELLRALWDEFDEPNKDAEAEKDQGPEDF